MDENLNTPTDMDRLDAAPPYAPLAMPRQVLEKERGEGLIGAFLRLLFARDA